MYGMRGNGCPHPVQLTLQGGKEGGCQADPHPHASGAATLSSGTAFLSELVHLQMGLEKKPNHL